ncbi:MAG TPA: T9SS type A sorting domain-containing protein, partial [Cyclobacteriaceae bacterium]|nr:T9SS type A sorting domain-containing protein [Cyclobacteriaceae bacterium]
TFSFDGFKVGENISNSGVTSPSITTSASQNSDAGSYSIGFTGGDGGSHYALNPVNGLLTIKKANQKIQFESSLPYNISNDTPPITFQAESSSGLPVIFQIIEGADIVTQNGSTFTLTGKTGIATIRIEQPGNINYNAANSVDRSFKVNLVLGLEPKTSAFVSMSPNPTQSELYIKASSIIKSITLIDMLGKQLNHIENLSATEYHLNLINYNQGMYLVSVATENEGIVTHRIVLE